jgi:hypothetical protein
MSPGLLKVAEHLGHRFGSLLNGRAEWWKSPCSVLGGPGRATARATRPARVAGRAGLRPSLVHDQRSAGLASLPVVLLWRVDCCAVRLATR